MITKGSKAQFAVIPALADHNLVIDLDIVVTIQKSALRGLDRVKGCSGDTELRQLGEAIGRHKSRFAFPAEAVDAFEKLRLWAREKVGRESDDGQFLLNLQEMRVSPIDLNNPKEVEIICILGPGWTPDSRAKWVKLLPKIEGKVDSNWCSKVSARIAAPEEMTVAEYFESVRLDFNAMSAGAR